MSETRNLPALLEALAEESLMRTIYVKSQEEMDAAIETQKALGYRIAAASNVGCPSGTHRLTFLPNSAFKGHPTHD